LLARLKGRYPRHVFAGTRLGEDLATHYASADLFLCPSLTETFGNVVPEALASGLGVVAFDCAAAADLIVDGSNGRTVASGDRQAFIDAALALADDRHLLASLRGQAAGSVVPLDWQTVHDRFARQLTELRANHDRKRNKQDLAPQAD
jgi:glycosyltransferase involved in cell wall biosynthesis